MSPPGPSEPQGPQAPFSGHLQPHHLAAPAIDHLMTQHMERLVQRLVSVSKTSSTVLPHMICRAVKKEKRKAKQLKLYLQHNYCDKIQQLSHFQRERNANLCAAIEGNTAVYYRNNGSPDKTPIYFLQNSDSALACRACAALLN